MYIAFGILVFLVALEHWNQAKQMDARLKAVNRRLDAIAGQLSALTGVAVATEDIIAPGVAELARSGQKVKAIKAYREATGARLSEAVEVIDRLARETAPEAAREALSRGGGGPGSDAPRP